VSAARHARTAADEQAFRAWLLTRGVLVTAVKGDPAWNLAVARTAAETITATTHRRGRPSAAA
jgi:hypothetical protein